MSVYAGLKQLEVISRGEDGGWEWVPDSGAHREKRVGLVAIEACYLIWWLIYFIVPLLYIIFLMLNLNKKFIEKNPSISRELYLQTILNKEI